MCVRGQLPLYFYYITTRTTRNGFEPSNNLVIRYVVAAQGVNHRKQLQDKSIPDNLCFLYLGLSFFVSIELHVPPDELPALWTCLIHPGALLLLEATFTGEGLAAAEDA